MRYIEMLLPLLPPMWGWLRRKKRKCHPKRGCLRVIPESVGRKLPPLTLKRY